LSEEEAARAIIEDILDGRIKSRGQVQDRKLELARQLGLNGLPSSQFVLSKAGPDERERVLPLLVRKPTRTASGVAVVAVQTSPSQTCPGHCIYCPQFPGASKSYTGHEPASMRAIQCGYDPHLQVRTRLRQLESMGHDISKVELIVQGATFTAMDLEYRRWFVARCLDAMIEHGQEGLEARSLRRAERLSETSAVRPVGITFETRPDWCGGVEVESMLHMGATRVEIGVQTLSDEVFRTVGRGHGVSEVARSFRAARSGGLKICAHMMLGLPGSGPEEDLESFRRLFEDPRFRPDELKIYPTLVIEGTKLHGMWRRGEYRPLTDEQVMEELLRIKPTVPPWIRIKRVMRDIPSDMISAGPRRSDMRNLVQRAMSERGERCRCIRCREVFRAPGNEYHFEPCSRTYEVEGGEEVFLSYEDPESEVLAAFLRLSAIDGEFRIRELHTYGPAVGIGNGPVDGEWQHRGMGRGLVRWAEELSIDRGADGISVTSGIGAREYYRELGYRLAGRYMFKSHDPR